MASVLAKGNATIIINPEETEARLVFVPDSEGFGWDLAAVNKLASEKNLVAYHDQKGLETFIIKASKAKSADPIELLFTEGIPPQDPVGEKVSWEALPVPADMAPFKEEALKAAGAPQIYRIKVEKIKHEKTVKKTGALSFVHAKEEVTVVWEKKETKEKVEVKTDPLEIKYADKGTKLGTLSSSIPGKPGKNVFGRQIPPPTGESEGFLLGNGITKEKNELHALVSGFIRVGENWADIVPMAKHVWSINTGIDGLTIFFHFEPGDHKFSPPKGEEILAAAVASGAKKESLISEKELDDAITAAIHDNEPLEAFSLCHAQEAEARVDINPDKTRAVLYLRKGLAGARPLEMKAISYAIKNSSVRGFDADKLRADINEFMNGKELVLSDYVLAEGTSSVRGKDRDIEISVSLFSDEEKKAHSQRLKNWYSYKTSNEGEFFLSNEDVNLAFVQKGEVVARVSAGSNGEDGQDIFGNVIPGLPGNDPDIKLIRGLEIQNLEIRSKRDGLLIFKASEKSFYGEVIKCQDAKIGIHISEDAMEVKADFFVEVGPGIPLTIENIKKVIVALGIKKGVNLAGLEKACAHAREHGNVLGFTLAEGESPIAPGGSVVKWLVPLGIPELAKADSHDGEEENINSYHGAGETKSETVQIKAGVPIVELSEPVAEGRPGYDVRGNPIPIEKGTALTIEHDESVREVPIGKGKRFVAARSGELSFDGNKLIILSIKTIEGDVDSDAGSIKFSGEIQISGNVLSGCKVMGGSHVTVSGYAEEALISAGGKVTVSLGFKGGGRGMLRARAGITSDFVERASVMAVGDIHLNKGTILSNIKTNGRLYIAADNGRLAGGICQARNGINAADIGSEKGVMTEISFGQDYLIKDEIGKTEEVITKIKDDLAELEEKISEFLNDKLPMPDDLRIEKIRLVKMLEQENLKIFTLREKFEEHYDSEIRIRGTIFPGVVMESHNRYYEVKQMRNRVVFYFDRESGRIKEKPLD